MDLVALEMCLSKVSVESIAIPKFWIQFEYVIDWLLMMIVGVVSTGLLRRSKMKFIVSVFRGLKASEFAKSYL